MSQSLTLRYCVLYFTGWPRRSGYTGVTTHVIMSLTTAFDTTKQLGPFGSAAAYGSA